MPQLRGGDEGAQAERRDPGSSARGGRARPSSSSGARSSGSTGQERFTHAETSTSSADAGFEAAAKRIRGLNERIIEAGKQTGETTLSAYEKALKAIATAVERGPGRSDIDWIAQLATAQAKFIREVTDAWTSAAREMLKSRSFRDDL